MAPSCRNGYTHLFPCLLLCQASRLRSRSSRPCLGPSTFFFFFARSNLACRNITARLYSVCVFSLFLSLYRCDLIRKVLPLVQNLSMRCLLLLLVLLGARGIWAATVAVRHTGTCINTYLLRPRNKGLYCIQYSLPKNLSRPFFYCFIYFFDWRVVCTRCLLHATATATATASATAAAPYY